MGVTPNPAGGSEREVFVAHILAIAERSDRAAFEALFEHFAPRVKAYLMRLGGGELMAEELAQETMVLVWRKAALYDPTKASPSTWIFTIARNRRIDAFRRESHPELDAEEPALQISGVPTADQALETKQSNAQIVEAMSKLSDNERQLLNLAYYEDKSHSTIATELKIPLGTVKSRLRQVFRKLRSDLSSKLGPQL
ncbi:MULTISPECIES: sigma-70 family RNA polymerase sigma factor [unclassified Devosia]|uniref:sigma-70 family RNA polymerase sigma factor n=1 Tax=unclassified Devosia TaxID=196773 RepID=UPI0023D80C70|nr:MULTISPECIES: sigma-70 family RNA polymerase sigma factor [unclassified Devosia]WEJ33595.1 sigma-70 family RNA polymerase sigma factor [Devosia sp. SD17-2]